MTADAELMELLAAAKAKVEAMSPTERAAMLAEQRASFVRAEMNWPKPRFRYIDGVKTYVSYEDYCNG